MSVIQCKLRLLEAIQNWYFECMLIKNYIEIVKIYTHCVCEISQWSESNCTFENQKIEITHKNYGSLNTRVTLIKQKLNYSQYVEQEQDIFRYVKNCDFTKEIRCHPDWIFPHLHQCYQWYSAPPLSNYGLFLAIYQCLRVFQVVVGKFWRERNLRLPIHFIVVL